MLVNKKNISLVGNVFAFRISKNDSFDQNLRQKTGAVMST